VYLLLITENFCNPHFSRNSKKMSKNVDLHPNIPYRLSGRLAKDHAFVNIFMGFQHIFFIFLIFFISQKNPDPGHGFGKHEKHLK